MLLLKTDKARQELMPGVRTLSLRERSLLLLADAKPMQELQAMYHGEGSRIVDELMRAGYLRHPSPTASTNDEPPASQALPLPRSRVPLRSLAGTPMYLFDIRERMFYPLVSGREGGSGLGLTIAQNFIQHHHGTIECESKPGRTVFIVRLPLQA